MQAFGLQPLYGRDAAQMAPMLLSNFADVATALQQASSELASGNTAILQSLTGKSKLHPSHLLSGKPQDAGHMDSVTHPLHTA